MSERVLTLPAKLIEMIFVTRQTPFPPSWKGEIYEFVDTISVPLDSLRGRLIIKRVSDATFWGITYRLGSAAILPWQTVEGCTEPPDLGLRRLLRQELVTYTWQEA